MSTSEVLQTEYLQNGEWLSWDEVEQEIKDKEKKDKTK